IPISTGTNNAYPKFWEGTNVGIAVSYLVQGNQEKICTQRDKQIEIYKNGKFVDVALVDVALTEVPVVGSKVVGDLNEVTDMIVARCSPDFIGLSTLIGCIHACEDEDDFGYHLHLCPEGTPRAKSVLVPSGSGTVDRIYYDSLKKVNVGKTLKIQPGYTGTIALDGERTVNFVKKDVLEFKVTRNGPYKVDVKKALYQAMDDGFFKQKKGKK
ncbi:MAG: ATP-NAD kinase, partial [Firmicutes bacterium]|nr:ATP-NAD kinase [Bacillota bacterium]